MSLSKPLAAVLAALVAFGGVAAAGTGAVGPQLATGDANSATNVDAQATYENGTVTVTVTDAGDPLQNVTVYAGGEAVGTTDANGTVAFDADATDELELELVGDAFEGELEYELDDGALALSEEEYEYDRDDESDDEDEADDEGETEDDEEESEDDEEESEDDEEEAEDEDDEEESDDDEAADDDEGEEESDD
jgi:hypothetical protein